MTQAQELKILFKELIELSPLEMVRKEYWLTRLENEDYNKNLTDELASEIGLALGAEEEKLDAELTEIEEQVQEIEESLAEKIHLAEKEEKKEQQKKQDNISLKLLEEIRKKLSI